MILPQESQSWTYFLWTPGASVPSLAPSCSVPGQGPEAPSLGFWPCSQTPGAVGIAVKPLSTVGGGRGQDGISGCPWVCVLCVHGQEGDRITPRGWCPARLCPPLVLTCEAEGADTLTAPLRLQ